jgi:hypothetical protein
MTNPPPPEITRFFKPVTTSALSWGTFFHMERIPMINRIITPTIIKGIVPISEKFIVLTPLLYF